MSEFPATRIAALSAVLSYSLVNYRPSVLCASNPGFISTFIQFVALFAESYCGPIYFRHFVISQVQKVEVGGMDNLVRYSRTQLVFLWKNGMAVLIERSYTSFKTNHSWQDQ
jgi:hypothetical protein